MFIAVHWSCWFLCSSIVASVKADDILLWRLVLVWQVILCKCSWLQKTIVKLLDRFCYCQSSAAHFCKQGQANKILSQTNFRVNVSRSRQWKLIATKRFWLWILILSKCILHKSSLQDAVEKPFLVLHISSLVIFSITCVTTKHVLLIDSLGLGFLF